jgi:hypothetical protein
VANDELNSYHEFQQRSVLRSPSDSYQRQELEAPQSANIEPSLRHQNSAAITTAEVAAEVNPAVMPGLKPKSFSEKTNLLEAND